MSYRIRFVVSLVLCFVVGFCSSCTGIAAPPLNIPAAQIERGADLARGGNISVEPLRVGIEVYYQLSYQPLDNKQKPLVMLSDEDALWLDASGQQLLQGNLFTLQAEVLVEAAANGSIASELVFDGRWLVWQQFGPWAEEQAGVVRQAELWVRDMSAEGYADILLDEGRHYSRDGVFYPFDSLSVDEDRLVYRFVANSGTGRHTEVRMVDLRTPELGYSSLFSADESNGRLIQRCSLSGSRVAWDVRLIVQEKGSGLPLMTSGYYSVYMYELDSSKYSVRENPLRQLTQNREYHSPLILGDRVFVTYHADHPITGVGYGSAVGAIVPSMLYYSSYTRSYAYANENILSMFEEGTARVAERSMPKAGRSLVTWSSSIPEEHIFFDTRISSLVELWPPGFAEDATVQQRYAYWETITLTPVQGLDADYFLSETQDGKTELVRIGLPRVPTLADTLTE